MTTASPQKNTGPKYLRLAQRLREEIRSGHLRPGDRMESLAEMHAQYGVTRPTAEKARDILEREGLIERVQGRGTFVRSIKKDNGGQIKGVMQNIIAVLTPQYDFDDVSRRTSGAPQHFVLGLMHEVYRNRRHMVSLSPQRLDDAGEMAQLLADQPYGVIVSETLESWSRLPHLLAELKRHDVPVAVYGDMPCAVGYDIVTSDHADGSSQLAHWLIERGHRRIVQLWPDTCSDYWFAGRDAGYRKALREAKLKPLPPVQYESHLPPEVAIEGFAQAERALFERWTRRLAGCLAEHLTGSHPVDAIMVHTDGFVPMAAGACRLLGKTPGVDVAIVGYDNYWADIPHRRFEPAALQATVDKRNAEIGAELVRLLLARVEGRLPDEPQRRVVASQLVEMQPSERLNVL